MLLLQAEQNTENAEQALTDMGLVTVVHEQGILLHMCTLRRIQMISVYYIVQKLQERIVKAFTAKFSYLKRSICST